MGLFYIRLLVCRRGGIGRRARLKIRFLAFSAGLTAFHPKWSQAL